MVMEHQQTGNPDLTLVFKGFPANSGNLGFFGSVLGGQEDALKEV